MNKKSNTGSSAGGKLGLKLFVSGMSSNSMSAIENIKHLCDQYQKESFHLEIIDIYKLPEAAQDNQVVFSPSLIKHFPLPKKTLIGTFSDLDKVIKALGLTIQ